MAKLAASGTFYGGSYWYASQRDNQIRRITFNADGSLYQDYLIAVYDSTQLHEYGDIDFDGLGNLYMSYSVVTNLGVPLRKELAVYNFTSNSFSILRSGAANDTSVSYLSQISFSQGVLYNHDTSSGNLTALSATDGSRGPTIFSSHKYTDVAFFDCEVPVSTLYTCPVATTEMTLFGLTQNRSGQVGGQIVQAQYNGVNWSTSVLANISSVYPNFPITTTSPNGLGFRAGTNDLYFASFANVENATSSLYKYNLLTKSFLFVGNLSGRSGGATVYNDYYWYVPQRTNEVHRVALNSSGYEISEEIVAHLPVQNGITLRDLGDMAFDSNGLLYISYSLFDENVQLDTIRQFVSFDVNTQVLTVIRQETIGDPASILGQVALAAKDVILNHNTASGNWTVLNAATGVPSSVFLNTQGFTDIAVFRCLNDFVPVSTTTTTTTTTTSTTTTTTTKATTTSITLN